MGPPVALALEAEEDILRHMGFKGFSYESLPGPVSIQSFCLLAGAVALLASLGYEPAWSQTLYEGSVWGLAPSGWVSSHQGQGLSRHHSEGHILQGLPPARKGGRGHQSHWWTLPFSCPSAQLGMGRHRNGRHSGAEEAAGSWSWEWGRVYPSA